MSKPVSCDKLRGRSRNRAIIVTEGKTERLYFQGIKQRNSGLKIMMPIPCVTDALNLVKYCVDRMKEADLCIENGDLAICIFDVDNNTPENIRRAIQLAQKNDILVAISNPCFELWYLLHFRPVEIPLTPDETKEMLNDHIENYEKAKDYQLLLTPKRNEAMKRAKALMRSKGISAPEHFAEENPSTAIPLVLDAIDEVILKKYSEVHQPFYTRYFQSILCPELAAVTSD